MSTSQKRDADMDRLLRTALKPSRRGRVAAGFEARSPGEGPAAHAGFETDPSACPEPALLAAFVEGGLTADEQSALDTHIAACGRCQASLAVLAHDVPEVEEEIIAAPESGWFTWVTRPRLRWLVPISAAATVAVVFFATRPLIAPEGEVPGAEVARMAQAPSTPAPVPEKNESAGAGRRNEAAKALVGQPAAEMMAARVASEEKPAPAAPAAAPPPDAGGQLAVTQRAANVPVAADEARKQAAAARKDALNFEAGPLIVPAPGGAVLWRFGAGGRISRSGDAGATWQEQASGVTVDLLAGAAPSTATCWVVGAAGTVLLSTDGERWEPRPFPEAVDLVAITASGSRTAVVTARDGRRFETTDAGLTWSVKQ